jgi:hypothetical protein
VTSYSCSITVRLLKDFPHGIDQEIFISTENSEKEVRVTS